MLFRVLTSATLHPSCSALADTHRGATTISAETPQTPLGDPASEPATTAHPQGTPLHPGRPSGPGDRPAVRAATSSVQCPSRRPGIRQVRQSDRRPERSDAAEISTQIENMLENVQSRVAQNGNCPPAGPTFRTPALSRPNVREMAAHTDRRRAARRRAARFHSPPTS